MTQPKLYTKKTQVIDPQYLSTTGQTSRVRQQLSLPAHRGPTMSKLFSCGQQPLVLTASSRLRHPPRRFFPNPNHDAPYQTPNLIG